MMYCVLPGTSSS